MKEELRQFLCYTRINQSDRSFSILNFRIFTFRYNYQVEQGHPTIQLTNQVYRPKQS